ncbi:MAG: hypothetical protein ACFFG0_45190, partial [Candidatus Thorarchaeota archaeon]
MKDLYKKTHGHIEDELILAYLLIKIEIFKKYLREKNDINFYNNSNLNYSEVAIETIQKAIKSPFDSFDLPHNIDENINQLLAEINKYHKEINEKKVRSTQIGTELRLVTLSELFNLSEIETRIICICMLPQLHYTYGRIFSFLYDDPSRSHPCPDLINSILYNSFEEKLSSENYFSYKSPLMKYRIIEFIEDLSDNKRPHELKQLKVNKRIIDYLFGKDILDEEIISFVDVFKPGHSLDDLIIAESLKENIQELLKIYSNREDIHDKNILFSFSGPWGSGKKTTAGVVCDQINIPLLIIDLKALYASGKDFMYMLQILSRESILRNAALYFNNCDFMFKNEIPYHIKKCFIDWINKNPRIIF